jgi:translation initiation factor 2 beta subunit (eIF-2beta)/eIF-5
LIEADEIFEQIKQDSQTIGQVITETNYILDELKDLKNTYADENSRCSECGSIIHITKDRNSKQYLECDNCGKRLY